MDGMESHDTGQNDKFSFYSHTITTASTITTINGSNIITAIPNYRALITN